MLDKLKKRKLYQSFLNGWDVIEEEEFIDELEEFCKMQDWEYDRWQFRIALVREDLLKKGIDVNV